MMATRRILHVDMDAFYDSVEQRDNPMLQGKPVLVGASAEQRGVVAACSYEARQLGVHSAMAMSQAIRLCPQAIALPVRMARYVEVSKEIHQIFYNHTPQVESLSIDEAFLDVTGCIELLGSAETIGKRVKQEIKAQTGLTASVGLAPNKFLAKLASDLEKPDGFVIITEQNKQQILDPLPVSKIWGIGKVTNQALKKVGIDTIGQLRMANTDTLARVFKNQVDDLLQLARGIDNREIQTVHETKSISTEETFSKDIQDKECLLGILQAQVEQVSQRLRAEKLQARTLTLKLRYGDFKTISRSSTLARATHTTQHLWEEAKEVFCRWYKSSAHPLRLLGFGTSNLVLEESEPKFLFMDPQEEKQKKLDSVVDEIRSKFGDNALQRGK